MAQSTDLRYIPTVFPKSPNAAAQERFGDYQVNLYSGLPSISIPLYTIESGSLRVPISISYHASGVKVNDFSSTVGLGWSLSAGGRVTRNVVGQPDEYGYFKSLSQGGYGNPGALSPFLDSDLDKLFRLGTNVQGYDSRPDIFSYDLPGHNGKFFYNIKENYNIKFIPYAPLKVLSPLTPPMSYTIIDEKGTLFKLGTGNTETTGTVTFDGTRYATTAWMLEQMLSQNMRDTVAFTYRVQNMQPPDQIGQIAIVEDTPMGFGDCSPPGISYNPQIYTKSTSFSVSQNDVQRITFKNGYVDFILSDKRSAPRQDLTNSSIAYSLDSIKIYAMNFGTKKYELQKTILFKTSYYGNGSSQIRLRLDGIQMLDKAGSVNQKYTFTYDPQPLPDYYSFSRDYWGYYNGKMDASTITNKTLIPRTTTDLWQINSSTPVTFGAETYGTRDPDSVKMQAGVLKRIEYPTGGYTDFNYSTNRYTDSAGIVHLTGGLRIASIYSYDSPTDANPIIKNYQYNAGKANFLTNNFTGIIDFGFLVHTSRDKYFISLNNTKICTSKRVRTYFAEPSNSLTPTEGNPVGYTNVTEYLGTPTLNIGKSVYEFSHKADEWSGSAASTGVPVMLDFFFQRGLLLAKTDYARTSGSTYQVIKKVSNLYSAFGSQKYDDVGIVVGARENSSGATYLAYNNSTAAGSQNEDTNRFPFTSYSIVSGDNYLKSVNTTLYDQNNPAMYTTSIVDYIYNNIKHQQINKIKVVDSKGVTKVTVNKYPADYLNGTTTNNTVLDNLLGKNMQAEVIETYDAIINAATGLNAVTSGKLNVYSNTKGSMAAVVPEQIKSLAIASPIMDLDTSRIVSGNLAADNRYLTMINFDSYDNKNNLIRYTPKSTKSVALLWDYQSALPIAEVKNAGSSEIMSNSFEKPGGWDASLTAYDQALKHNGRYSGRIDAPGSTEVYSMNSTWLNVSLNAPKRYHYSGWVYSNGPVADIYLFMKRAGETGYYSHVDYVPTSVRGKWVLVEKDFLVPADVTQLNIRIDNNGTANGGNKVWFDDIRLYPSDAQMTTYTYDPLVGMTSMTDAKGLTTTYEYDGLQRLLNIRDQDGNIIKHTDYNYANQSSDGGSPPVTTYTSIAQSAPFTRNCGSGINGSTVIFSVAASAYTSTVSQAAANQQALDYVNANGQAYANANGTCPVMVNVSLSNTTGASYYANFASSAETYTRSFFNTGSATVQVPAGTYTVDVIPTGTYVVRHITMGSRPTVNAPRATFTNVNISAGSPDLSISITP